METTALEYYSEVKGKKMHYIFRQGVVYYVFTQSDGGKFPRGHFSAIPQSEVNAVEGHIEEAFPLNLFHPRELNILQAILVKDHREERMRDICYILVANGFLNIQTVAREIQFSKAVRATAFNEESTGYQRQNTVAAPKSKEKAKQIKVQRGGGYFTCPDCRAALTKESQNAHRCNPMHRARK